MAKSTVLTTSIGQAVFLPRDVAFPDDVQQVDVLKVGRGRLIVPTGSRWSDFFETGPHASEDVMTLREQPSAEPREF
ncbi:MAG: type II toxin-antitoxin system VapB family antitoxin [Bauldia sp.]